MEPLLIAKRCRLNPAQTTRALRKITRAFILFTTLGIPTIATAADITWVGPAQGNWDEPTNWSSDTNPLSTDSVTISTATVTINTAVTLSGAFILNSSALLVVDGATASFTATGTTIENATLQALNGGQGSFPNLTSYT